MTNRIKKGALPEPVGRVHKTKELPDDLLRFSFRHLELDNNKFCIPDAKEKPTYFNKLLERFKDVSGYTVSRFRTEKSHGLKAHVHDWSKSSEKAGYSHLSEQLQQCEPWQFCLSVNEHGRVHGILIDDVFYVVWLDHGHQLYP